MALNDILSLPALADGSTYSAGGVWNLGSKTQLTSGLSDDIVIMGASWYISTTTSLSTICEEILEIYTGAAGSEVLQIQIPLIVYPVSDVGYRIPRQEFYKVILPEPFQIIKNTRISFRIVNGSSGTVNNTAIKIKYQIVNLTNVSGNFLAFF